MSAPLIPPKTELLGDKIEQLSQNQQNQLLWRLVYGHAEAVEKALAQLEERGWKL